MSRPRFLADEDLRGNIVHAVRRLEYDIAITSIVEEGLSGITDDEVLDYCWEYRLLLLSHDVNTMKSAAEQRIMHGGSIHGLFLVPQSRPTRLVADSLVLIWTASEFEEWCDRIVYLPL